MANIVLNGVVKRFGAFTAVNRISAEIEDGEFITLLGPSGCGKTTLLNMISGFLKLNDGRIEIGGQDVTNTPPENRDTAMCFQSYALFPHLTVRENLAFGLRQQKWDKDKLDQRVNEVAGQLELDVHLPKLPNQLSGGQQQRVALGRALAVRPGVVLFDEPLSNLDAKLRESVRIEIRKIQAQARLTAIYVTHDQSEALAMSDRIFVMNAGHIEQSGTPDEIYNSPATRFVADFIGAANLLEGEVIAEIGNQEWSFQTQIGQLIVKCDTPPSHQNHYLCWRPEDAVIGAKSGDAENRLTAAVETTAFQGAFTDVFSNINGLSQRLQVGGAFPPSAKTIEFSIPKTAIHLLEPVA